MPACTSCGAENPDGFRFCGACAAPLVAVAADHELRKTVTVLFCDVAGSTALGERLDPESLRALLARYFERMRVIVERHGGTVEKFIGDAVMAVFGVPRLHEDDALRALRAAVEMRDVLPELGIQGRVGVATGEVVTGTEERLATGDAVNVAARLEQAAEPGEILVSAATIALVRGAVETEPSGAIPLKGKAEPVSAFRLRSVLAAEPRSVAGTRAPLVGRGRQLRLLHEVFVGVVDDRTCHLVTILGAAGVGKSRLAAEFLARVDARVIRGRCLSYGEGITYWPVVEILDQLGSQPGDPMAVRVIAALRGEVDDAIAPGDIAWAVRKTLEDAAREEPLVCVFDDIHWAEPGLLDLIDHVADYSRDAPLLVLCLARPELLDRRSSWAGGKMNATTVLLQPLTSTETDELIDGLGSVDPALRSRIRDAAEGNPLFVEEMLAMLRASDTAEVTVPPSIQALLAARLDQLDDAERGVLERGAVEGKVFHRGAVEALAPTEGEDVAARLMSLVRRELVRPDQAQIAGEDAFRFRHLLIRDAAYDALPKAKRADLHERFAGWLADRGADLIELDEILGYHLEHACRYRAELGLRDGDGHLEMEARRRFTHAGERAMLRSDYPAAINLFERAAALAGDERVDLVLELDRIEAVFNLGRMTEAHALAVSLAERGAATNDRVAELCGCIQAAGMQVSIQPEGALDRLAALVEEALPELETLGSDLGLFVAYEALGFALHMRARSDAAPDAWTRAIEYARRAGIPHVASRLSIVTGTSHVYGTTTAADVLAWLDQQARERIVHPHDQGNRAVALAMLGRFDEARTTLKEAQAQLAERGATVELALSYSHVGPEMELIAGDPAAAARYAEQGCQMLEQVGERAWLSTGMAYLASAYYDLDRLDQADATARQAGEIGSSNDAATQMISRQIQAKVAAHRGEHPRAEQLAREAIAIADTTDHLNEQGNAYSDLADILITIGKTQEAAQALETAATLFAQKGNIPAHERVRARLASVSVTRRSEPASP